MAVDYAALAKQYGGTTAQPTTGSVDYGTLAKQFGGTTIAPTPVASTPATQPHGQAFTIPSDPNNDSPVVAGAKTVANIPASAVRFGAGAVQAINPIHTAKNLADYFSGFGELSKNLGSSSDAALAVVKEVPHTLYEAFVPQFVRSLVHGDTQTAEKAIVEDPVGQIAPLLMYGRAIAEKAGATAQFDAAVSKAASPVTKAGTAAKQAAGNVAAQTLGVSTGTGASSVKAAFSGSDAFVQAMRGHINPDEVVQTAQDAVSTIANNRRTSYLADLQKIGGDTKSIDISPIHNELQSQLKSFNITVKPDGTLDFSRSAIANNGSARADVQGVYSTLKDWGTQKGDRTAIGLDTLKKQLGDFYSESGSARAFVQAVKSKVTSTLQDNVPGYRDMTTKYQTASSLLDDIKSATGAGSKAKVDTVFTKMTTAMKADKDLRLEVMQHMQAAGEQPHLMDKIAGINMQSWVPRGLVGKGADVMAAYSFLAHSFNPQYIPVLLMTSPRVVGEFVRAMGVGADKAGKVIDALNTVAPAIAEKFNAPASAQSNLSRERTQ